MRALITGGTSGIGYGVAKQLAKYGWDIIIIGRNSKRGNQVASEIRGTFIQADLSLMSEVHRVAQQINQSIDALIMCAGCVSTRSELTKTQEGFESTFAINYLSKFMLSQLIIPKINVGGSIVLVGGNGKHKNVTTDWVFHHTGFQAAFKAALAVDLYASRLAVQNNNVRVHTCYPGMVRTNLMNDAALPFRLLTSIFGQSIEKGSAYLTRLVIEKHQGIHWMKDKKMQFNPALPTNEVDGLWEYSQQLLIPYMQPVFKSN